MTDEPDDDTFDVARERGRQFMESMSDEERTVFIGRALANSAFAHDALPKALLPKIFAAIEEIADDGRTNPEEVAIEAFRRHGYRAEMQEMGEVAMMRAVRVQA